MEQRERLLREEICEIGQRMYLRRIDRKSVV